MFALILHLTLLFLLVASRSQVFDAYNQRPEREKYCKQVGRCKSGEQDFCRYGLDINVMGPRCGRGKRLTITEDMQNYALELINAYRRKLAKKQEKTLPPAYGMNKLLWNNTLAHAAQVWANQCNPRIMDNCPCTEDYPNAASTIGVVAFKYPSGASMNNTIFKGQDKIEHIFRTIVELLAFEKQSVSKELITRPTSKAITNSYLIMVKGTSTHVGCGMSEYIVYVQKDGRMPKLSYEVLVVCNFSSMPTVNEKVYETESVQKPGYSSCGCPANTDEDDCLCTSKISGKGEYKGKGDNKGKGDDSKEKGSDSKEKGENNKGKGSDSKEKGDSDKGKGDNSKEKGSDSKEKGENNKGKGSDSKEKGDSDKGKGDNSKEKGSDSKEKNENNKGKGSDSKEKGDNDKGKGDNSKEKGSDSKEKSENNKGKGNDSKDKGDSDKGKGDTPNNKGDASTDDSGPCPKGKRNCKSPVVVMPIFTVENADSERLQQVQPSMTPAMSSLEAKQQQIRERIRGRVQTVRNRYFSNNIMIEPGTRFFNGGPVEGTFPLPQLEPKSILYKETSRRTYPKSRPNIDIKPRKDFSNLEELVSEYLSYKHDQAGKSLPKYRPFNDIGQITRKSYIASVGDNGNAKYKYADNINNRESTIIGNLRYGVPGFDHNNPPYINNVNDEHDQLSKDLYNLEQKSEDFALDDNVNGNIRMRNNDHGLPRKYDNYRRPTTMQKINPIGYSEPVNDYEENPNIAYYARTVQRRITRPVTRYQNPLQSHRSTNQFDHYSDEPTRPRSILMNLANDEAPHSHIYGHSGFKTHEDKNEFRNYLNGMKRIRPFRPLNNGFGDSSVYHRHHPANYDEELGEQHYYVPDRVNIHHGF